MSGISPEGTWTRRAFRAMGTEMALLLAAPELPATRVEQLLAQGEALVRQYEEVMTRFRMESELSRVNRWAGSWVQVGPLLFDAIRLARQAAWHTDGLFDPTVGRALAALGYDRSFELLPHRSDQAPQLPEHAAEWQNIELDPRRLAIRIPRGVAIDLGGIGKGYTADAVAGFLGQYGAALVDAGGDIRAAGRPADGSAWRVGVASPFEEERDIAILRLVDAACATSTTLKRRWERAGAIYHHIVDPRTGRPAVTDLVSVTVVAPSAAEAEVHAKVALLLGQRAATGYFAARPALAAILVGDGGRALMTESMEPWLEL